jgi:hypothetical protein
MKIFQKWQKNEQKKERKTTLKVAKKRAKTTQKVAKKRAKKGGIL